MAAILFRSRVGVGSPPCSPLLILDHFFPSPDPEKPLIFKKWHAVRLQHLQLLPVIFSWSFGSVVPKTWLHWGVFKNTDAQAPFWEILMWPSWDLGLREAPWMIEGEVYLQSHCCSHPFSFIEDVSTWLSLRVNCHHFHRFQCPCLSLIQLYWAQYLFHNKYFKFYNIHCYAPFTIFKWIT